jgi:ribosomal protein S18 acetylase RimI-like enzyme
MSIREATTDDAEAIRSVAQRSLEASYSLSPRSIESAIKQWYNDDALEITLGNEHVVFLIAERDGEVVGLAEAVLTTDTGEGDMLWVHVDPGARGEDIGADLFEHTSEILYDRGAEYLRGMVLEDNREGGDFYERFGFERTEERTAMIDGEPHAEFVYIEGGVASGDESEAIEGTVSVPETVSLDGGGEGVIDQDDNDHGSKGPFFIVYETDEFDQRYGYYCGNCGTLDTAMDAMGRVQCNDCGNLRKPTRWDAAYL